MHPCNISKVHMFTKWQFGILNSTLDSCRVPNEWDQLKVSNCIKNRDGNFNRIELLRPHSLFVHHNVHVHSFICLIRKNITKSIVCAQTSKQSQPRLNSHDLHVRSIIFILSDSPCAKLGFREFIWAVAARAEIWIWAMYRFGRIVTLNGYVQIPNSFWHVEQWMFFSKTA